MSKFILGPTATRGGLRAHIYAIEDRIYGKLISKEGHWFAATWELDGKSAGWTDRPEYYDLDYPDRAKYVTQFYVTDTNNYSNTCGNSEDKKVNVVIKGYGKYKVTIEEQ